MGCCSPLRKHGWMRFPCCPLLVGNGWRWITLIFQLPALIEGNSVSGMLPNQSLILQCIQTYFKKQTRILGSPCILDASVISIGLCLVHWASPAPARLSLRALQGNCFPSSCYCCYIIPWLPSTISSKWMLFVQVASKK